MNPVNPKRTIRPLKNRSRPRTLDHPRPGELPVSPEARNLPDSKPYLSITERSAVQTATNAESSTSTLTAVKHHASVLGVRYESQPVSQGQPRTRNVPIGSAAVSSLPPPTNIYKVHIRSFTAVRPIIVNIRGGRPIEMDGMDQAALVEAGMSLYVSFSPFIPSDLRLNGPLQIRDHGGFSAHRRMQRQSEGNSCPTSHSFS